MKQKLGETKSSLRKIERVLTTSDYELLTQEAGVLERPGRAVLLLDGSEAADFLQGQVTNDVEALTPGHGCYAAFLTHKGKMLGDLRILDTGEELLLDTERGALQELFNMIRRYKLGRALELHKRTVELGLLSLIGPDARRVAGVDPGADEHANARDGELLVVATDAGLDVFCPAPQTDAVRARFEAAGAVPVAEEAAEVLRVERGRPRYGADLDDSVIPQEAGLNERAVSFTKGCYIGQETVARLFYRGKPNRHLRGLRLSALATSGDPLRLGEKEVGRLGTVVTSPAEGPIALALVRREASPGDTLRVGAPAEASSDGPDEAPSDVTAEVVELPFRE